MRALGLALAIMVAGCGRRVSALEALLAEGATDEAPAGQVLVLMAPMQAEQLPQGLLGFDRGFGDLVNRDLAYLGVKPPSAIEPATVAIASQLLVMGDQLRVEAQVTRMPPSEPEIVGEASANGPIEAFPEVQAKVVRQLAKILGLPNPRKIRPTTRDIVAVVKLGLALQAIEDGDRTSARAHLQAARNADPGFQRVKTLQKRLAPR